MRKSKFSENEISSILKQAELGTSVFELCETHGMSRASFYKWRSRYGGMETSTVCRVKVLEEENRRLKRLVDEEKQKIAIIQEVMAKKW